MAKLIGFSGAPRDAYCRAVERRGDRTYMGCRRGGRQDWPVFSRLPPVTSGVPGGTCPPHAPLTEMTWNGRRAFSCVERTRALGAIQLDERWQAAALLLAGVVLGGVTYKLVQGRNK